MDDDDDDAFIVFESLGSTVGVISAAITFGFTRPVAVVLTASSSSVAEAAAALVVRVTILLEVADKTAEVSTSLDSSTVDPLRGERTASVLLNDATGEEADESSVEERVRASGMLVDRVSGPPGVASEAASERPHHC